MSMSRKDLLCYIIVDMHGSKLAIEKEAVTLIGL